MGFEPTTPTLATGPSGLRDIIPGLAEPIRRHHTHFIHKNFSHDGATQVHAAVFRDPPRNAYFTLTQAQGGFMIM